MSKIKTVELKLNYPFYITEDHEGFGYYSEKNIIFKIEEYISEMDQRDNEWCYTNLYRIGCDFEPKYPGKDRMGILHHHHVNNETLNNIIKNGFNELW